MIRADVERPVTRYLIAGYKRSGTTFTHLLLKGHPRVSALNDEMTVAPFFDGGVETYTIGGCLSSAERNFGRRRLFDAIVGANEPVADAFGAKIAIGNARAAASVVECLGTHMPDMKVILVRRSDIVAQYGSLLQRRRTHVAHSWNPGFGKSPVARIRIDRILFARYVAGVFDTLAELDKLRATNDVLDVCYEDLSANVDGQYRRILEFLGLSYTEATWLDSKKVLPPPAEYITNYDEMASLQARIQDAHAAGAISRSWRKAVGLYCRGHTLLTAGIRRP